MITHNDQMDLFRLISKNISQNIECYAFGGNAMMFYGYKDETKDVDLVFKDEKSRLEFIKAIKKLGYQETSPFKIYIPKKLREKHRPLMFKRGDGRFDLFVEKILKTELSPKMGADLYAIHEFKDEYNLKINVLRKEHIVLLKAVTERDKDFEDILTIISKEKNFDWQYLIDEACWQSKHGDSWVLIDLDKVMRDLKKDIFIEEKYFKQIYKAQKK